MISIICFASYVIRPHRLCWCKSQPTKCYRQKGLFTGKYCKNHQLEQLVGGLLGVESRQDAVIRTLLYKRSRVRVVPYGITVGEFTNRISDLRNKLAHTGLKDQGISLGHLLAADTNSLSYARQPQEILRIVYGTGKEQIPGGFYPKGANGAIARKYFKTQT
ncbi:hypothetical protein L1987_00018 [Smallanthus sonchifolius]|uniref:Uncharacterized protein n=1 Tax=Smallanthus sonchifolius TaxID=185202 RepID=A0ACB9K1C3_9ASTR|nr:hypothetical protein L1987_00018 [Smallanthus sonchifolius]